jgi:hypothetical protein
MSFSLPPQVVKTTNPSVTDDASQGFFSGYTWANSSTKIVYYCISSALGAAVWVQLGLSLSLAYTTTSYFGTDNLGNTSGYGTYTTAAGTIV